MKKCLLFSTIHVYQMFDKHIYAMWDDYIAVPPTGYERMTVKTRPSLRTGSPRHNEIVLSA